MTILQKQFIAPTSPLTILDTAEKNLIIIASAVSCPKIFFFLSYENVLFLEI